jgi:hypothetical protein
MNYDAYDAFTPIDARVRMTVLIEATVISVIQRG